MYILRREVRVVDRLDYCVLIYVRDDTWDYIGSQSEVKFTGKPTLIEICV